MNQQAAVAALAISLSLASTVSAATLSLSTLTPEIFVGESIDVDLVVSELDPAGSGPLGAFDVSVLQGPVLLGFSSYSLGAGLGDPLLDALDVSRGDLGGGVVNVAESSFLPTPDLIALQAPSFTLATLSFTALSTPGDTTLSILGALLSDSPGLVPIDVTGTTDLVVTVKARPTGLDAPPGLGLILAGALAALTSRRNRRRAGS